jgi:hypothetical protein
MLRKDFILRTTENLLNKFISPITTDADRPKLCFRPADTITKLLSRSTPTTCSPQPIILPDLAKADWLTQRQQRTETIANNAGFLKLLPNRIFCPPLPHRLTQTNLYTY